MGTGPEYPWGKRVYGGQVVAQALRAAALTVDGPYLTHSLHAYFIRAGDCDEPIRYEVDRLRNGRSFVTRQVVARQSGGAILNLSCSFQVDEDQADVQVGGLPPEVERPGPGGIDDSWGTFLERQWAERPGPGSARTWLRVVGPIGEDPILHQCALAYASDDAPMEASLTHHPLWTGDDTGWDRLMTASLDHAMWFHRPVTGDAWHLYDLVSEGIRGGRGMAHGRVLTTDGVHVASVAQEVLIRDLRTGT
ncbi:MAG TPA: acyl-CoA thioesterase domain-containing protein [Acidimicrobiales bacterium]|nr:acyl-CoA thioesterase domain-containing protein [Acidimicrobiales bacterium]